MCFRHRRRLLLVACLLAVTGWGCAGDEPLEPLSIDLGTGARTFVSVTGGQTIDLVFGPQGGWHVDASVQFTGLDDAASGISLTYRLEDAASGHAVGYPYKVFSTLDALEAGDRAGRFDRIGDRVVIIDTPAEVEARELRFSVDANVGGEFLQDELEIFVVDPP